MSPYPTSKALVWFGNPARFTFVASLLLSAIAVGTGNLNRDGMLYVEGARAFIEGGLPAAKAIFSWPLLPVIMGSLSMAIGISPESCGHVLNALFMAGACALTVSIIRREEVGLAWFGAAVVLALPGLNEYRNELIREYGSWFFTMLAFRLAQEWPSQPAWRLAAAIQAAIAAATLFRPEAAAFFVSILLWQHFQPSPATRATRALLLGSLPVAMLLAVIAAHFAGLLPATSRLAGEISRFDYGEFDRTAQGIAQALKPYAREEQRTAHAILFFGSIALIPWKFLTKLGIFIVPLWFFLRSPMRNEYFRRFGLQSWAFLLHTFVLGVFVLQQQFVAGRYIAPLLLFATPFVAHGLHRMTSPYPRWRNLVFFICVAIALQNVINSSQDRRHLRDAGAWLSQHGYSSERTYLHDPQIAHYANWSYSRAKSAALDEATLKQTSNKDRYDALALTIPIGNTSLEQWAGESGLREIQRFTSRSGKSVVIYSPTPASEHESSR